MQMKLKIGKLLLVLLIALILGFFAGPKVEKPGVDGFVPELVQNITLQELEAQIASAEKSTEYLKADNESRILWLKPDSLYKTEYVLLYLHGFSASPKEGYPINYEFGKHFGMNTYIPRLYGHGLDSPDNLADMTPDNLLNSAKEALNVARKLGDKIIIMSTSTGGTLSLLLASENEDIVAQILFSPNIEINDNSAKILTLPWGLKLGKMIAGETMSYDDEPEVQKYWQSQYRIEGIAYLQSLVENTMKKSTFEKIKQPLFLGYYYKNELEQDPTVKVSAMLEMFEQISTPADFKRQHAFANVGVHPLASGIKSKDIDAVRNETYKFAEEILHLKPLND
jgi:esterase/lipase